MRTKNYLIVFIVVITYLLVACNKQEEKIKQIEVGSIIKNTIHKEIFVSQDEHLNEPLGIVSANSMIYVVCKGSDTICQYDYDGNFINELGKSGNGKGEFLSPVAIVADSLGNLYIAEEGNSRVQVIDSEGNYIKEYPIKGLDVFGCYLLDIELNNLNDIYISFKTFDKKTAKVLKINSDGSSKMLGSELCGIMGNNTEKSNLIFAQTYNVDDNRVYTGDTFLAKIENNNVSKWYGLPYSYTPTDIVMSDEKLYMYSYSMNKLDAFSLEGEYIETIYKGDLDDSSMGFYYLGINEIGDIYASNSEKNEIYVFHCSK
jgi:DNA-binding beta-propeller fold protein YncE